LENIDFKMPDNEKSTSWVRGDFETPDSNFLNTDFNKYSHMTPVEIFELFFDDKLILYLVEQSKIYSLFKNVNDFDVTDDEIRCFIGILILSGYNVLPGKRFYWYSLPDVGNEFVKDSMRRDRFISIMRFIHCANNHEMNINDKFWKLRPVVNMLKNKFLEHFIPSQNLNYDESMVKYFGKHSCKQFIRGKPIRFGYKVWCLNTPDGYLINFDFYQGLGPKRNITYEKLVGKCTAPMVTMLEEFPKEIKNLPYRFYFDNLFTGLNLLKFLKLNGYQGTGTMRENRMPKECPMSNQNCMMKKNRGEIESAIEKNSGTFFARWKDNGVVTIGSTIHGINPLSKTKRYSKAQKKVVQVDMPNCVSMYNKYMGGTDQMDENIARHRIGIRGKKWWWSLFTWLIDVAITNAWRLHVKSGHNSTQLEFRRSIVQEYLTRFKNAPKRKGRPSNITSRVPEGIRFDRLDHYVMSTIDGKRKRCAGATCSSSVRTMCSKCDVGLCIDCFKIFHTK
jgi:hypothetical protein